MAELTPKERVMRLLRKEPIDTMPFFSGMGMVVMPGIKKAGVNFPTFTPSAERMAMVGHLVGKTDGLRLRRHPLRHDHGVGGHGQHHQPVRGLGRHPLPDHSQQDLVHPGRGGHTRQHLRNRDAYPCCPRP